MGWKIAGVLAVLCGYIMSFRAASEDNQWGAIGAVFLGAYLLARGSAESRKGFFGLRIGPSRNRYRVTFAFLLWMGLAVTVLAVLHVIING